MSSGAFGYVSPTIASYWLVPTPMSGCSANIWDETCKAKARWTSLGVSPGRYRPVASTYS